MFKNLFSQLFSVNVDLPSFLTPCNRSKHYPAIQLTPFIISSRFDKKKIIKYIVKSKDNSITVDNIRYTI